MAERVRPTRVLSWWFVVFLAVMALGAGSAYVYVVGFLFGPGHTISQRLNDALQAGLLVVACVSGLVLLLVLARAQWLRERAQRYRELADAAQREHVERVHAHEERVSTVRQREQEQIARATEADAIERRTVDHIMRAVEQLGSEQHAVRLGALAVLERLAQNQPEHRQAIVDVVCGYLRLPSDGPPELGPQKVVRQAAQRMLLRHLSPADRRTQWRGLRLDLSGATLVDFDATGCVLSSVDFGGAAFLGTTSFAGSIFDSQAVFAAAHFGGNGVTFEGARFALPAEFRRVTFGCRATFDLAEFTGGIAFERTLFDAGATFNGSRFVDTVSFTDVDFGGATSFQGAAFETDIALVRTMFRNSVSFAESTLGGTSWFEEVRATRTTPHVFPPGYREVPIDGSWAMLEHEMPAETAEVPPAALRGDQAVPVASVDDPTLDATT
ncbi:MAG TPA: pentapeptide repeat-containing protein [Actinopolymorphaceae bacterium]